MCCCDARNCKATCCNAARYFTTLEPSRLISFVLSGSLEPATTWLAAGLIDSNAGTDGVDGDGGCLDGGSSSSCSACCCGCRSIGVFERPVPVPVLSVDLRLE